MPFRYRVASSLPSAVWIICGFHAQVQAASVDSLGGRASANIAESSDFVESLDARYDTNLRSDTNLGTSTSVLLRRKKLTGSYVTIHGMSRRAVHKTAYYGQLDLGEPPQIFSVVFDSGSGNLIVPGTDCMTEACRSHNQFNDSLSRGVRRIGCDGRNEDATDPDSMDEISISFGTGEVSGHCLEDLVCLGHVCSRGSFIATDFESSNPFENFAFDGVLGLALMPMSQGAEFNLMSRLTSSNTLQQPVFSVFFSDDDDEGSEITFGEIKKERLDSELIWADVARNSGYWEVQIDDITIDNKMQTLCKDCFVAVDTGTSELAGPSDVIEKLARVLNVQKNCSNYNELPRLGFVLGDHVLNLEPRDYIDKADDRCDVALMPLDVPPPNGPLFVFGIPFLQKFYTVYDARRSKVGFAVAKHRSVEKTQPEKRSSFLARAFR